MEKIEQDKPSCGKCLRRNASGYCNLQGRKVRNQWQCEGYKMKLSEHYVPNPWSEWKDQQLRNLAMSKKKK